MLDTTTFTKTGTYVMGAICKCIGKNTIISGILIELKVKIRSSRQWLSWGCGGKGQYRQTTLLLRIR